MYNRISKFTAGQEHMRKMRVISYHVFYENMLPWHVINYFLFTLSLFILLTSKNCQRCYCYYSNSYCVLSGESDV